MYMCTQEESLVLSAMSQPRYRQESQFAVMCIYSICQQARVTLKPAEGTRGHHTQKGKALYLTTLFRQNCKVRKAR